MSYKPSRAWRKAARRRKRTPEPTRLYTAEEVITETGDREVLTVIRASGTRASGHWYEDHMLTILTGGSRWRKTAGGLFKEA